VILIFGKVAGDWQADVYATIRPNSFTKWVKTLKFFYLRCVHMCLYFHLTALPSSDTNILSQIATYLSDMFII